MDRLHFGLHKKKFSYANQRVDQVFRLLFTTRLLRLTSTMRTLRRGAKIVLERNLSAKPASQQPEM